MLMCDSRTSLSEIAKETNISNGNIRNRFNRLKEEGIIKGEIMDIDPNALGYKTTAIIMLRTVSSNISEIVTNLKKIPEILAIANGFGRKNIVCFVSTHDTDELNHTVENIRNIPGILETETNLKVGSKRSSYPENIQFME